MVAFRNQYKRIPEMQDRKMRDRIAENAKLQTGPENAGLGKWRNTVRHLWNSKHITSTMQTVDQLACKRTQLFSPGVGSKISRQQSFLCFKLWWHESHNQVVSETTMRLISDFVETSVLAFQHMLGNTVVSELRFHYSQAVIKRVQKLGLEEAYTVP